MLQRSGFWLCVLAVVALTFVAMVKCARAETDEWQARRDCTADALRYCKSAIAKGSRDGIIACMRRNRDKLTGQCARHLH